MGDPEYRFNEIIVRPRREHLDIEITQNHIDGEGLIGVVIDPKQIDHLIDLLHMAADDLNEMISKK